MLGRDLAHLARSRLQWCAAAAAAVVFLSSGGAARAIDDAPAPSLALPLDTEPAPPAFALTANAVDAALGLYALRFEYALAAHHALRTRWGRDRPEGAALLEAGYALVPQGTGVGGLHLEALLALRTHADGRAPQVRAGVQVRYVGLWQPIVLAAGLGAEAGWNPQGPPPWRIRIALELGWFWP